MKELGVLIHGAGWVSTQHIKAFQNNPNTRVVAVSSRRLESCRKRAEEAGLAGILLEADFRKALEYPGVDIVVICTPQHLHARDTVAAAEAGKHIVIEKPIAISLEEMHDMREAVRKARVKTVASFVLRWNPLFRTLKRMIADDTLGDIYSVEADYQSNIASWWSGFEDGRRKRTGVSAGLVAGCHAIDALRWFAEKDEFRAAKPIEVFGYSGGWRKGSSLEFDYLANVWREDRPPLEYDGLEVMLVKFENGVIGKVAVNFDAIMPYNFPLEIFGTKGTVKNNRVWSHKFPGQTDWVEIPTIQPDTADVRHHPFQGEIDHFVECILRDEESHCNLEDAIITHEIALGALRCYETGAPVQLPLMR
jgi:predicted dehydrogenase